MSNPMQGVIAEGDLRPSSLEPLAPGQLYQPYTVLLLVYGVLSLLWAAVLQILAPGLGLILMKQPALSPDLHLFLGTAALFAAVLRRSRGAAALPASIALMFGLALDFPFGSAVTVYWLIRIRRIERQPLSRERAVDLYTMWLYLASLGCGLAMMMFHGLLPGLDLSGIFGIFAAVYGGLTLLLLVVATLRCLSRQWGYVSTFGLNVLLALLVPVGTVASLVWFLGIRKREREILADPHGFAVTAEFE